MFGGLMFGQYALEVLTSTTPLGITDIIGTQATSAAVVGTQAASDDIVGTQATSEDIVGTL